jgi:hypothetical protein
MIKQTLLVLLAAIFMGSTQANPLMNEAREFGRHAFVRDSKAMRWPAAQPGCRISITACPKKS